MAKELQDPLLISGEKRNEMNYFTFFNEFIVINKMLVQSQEKDGTRQGNSLHITFHRTPLIVLMRTHIIHN